jgi:hypothetical protein
MSTGHQDENANDQTRQMIQNLRHQAELKRGASERTENPVIRKALEQDSKSLEKRASELETKQS